VGFETSTGVCDLCAVATAPPSLWWNDCETAQRKLYPSFDPFVATIFTFFLPFRKRTLHEMALSQKMLLAIGLIALMGTCHAYYADMKEPLPFVSDALLRDFMDAMGKDLIEDVSDEYADDDALSLGNARLALMARAAKDQDERLMDYGSLLERTNPHPSLRDQEFLQHSSIWGHQFMSGGAGEGPRVVKPQVKTDATLPAYCNPPNPCPVGYTEDQGCTMDFENTASFSREYQGAQECMCDVEHMFECPASSGPNQANNNGQQDFGSFLSRQFPQEHKNLVAKKFNIKKVSP